MDGNLDMMIVDEESTEKSLVDLRTKLFEMNAKPDSKTKVFERKVVVSMDSIQDLYNDIEHKLRSYENGDNIGITTQVIIDYEKNKSFSFTSWDSFFLEKNRESSAVMGITLVWDCSIKFKQYELPQRHKIVVKLINNLSKTEILNLLLTGNLEDTGPINAKIGPVIARIDFVDYLFAEELLYLIESWNKCLKTPDVVDNKMMMWLKKKRRWVSYSVVYVTFFISISICLNYMVSIINSKNLQFVVDLETSMLTSWFTILTYIVIGLIVFYKFLDYLGNLTFLQLERYGDYHMFDISRGDEVLNDKIRKNEKNTMIRVYIKLGGAIILNTIATLVSNMIQSFV